MAWLSWKQGWPHEQTAKLFYYIHIYSLRGHNLGTITHKMLPVMAFLSPAFGKLVGVKFKSCFNVSRCCLQVRAGWTWTESISLKCADKQVNNGWWDTITPHHFDILWPNFCCGSHKYVTFLNKDADFSFLLFMLLMEMTEGNQTFSCVTEAIE